MINLPIRLITILIQQKKKIIITSSITEIVLHSQELFITNKYRQMYAKYKNVYKERKKILVIKYAFNSE